MKVSNYNLVIVGVGGQGIIRTAKIVSWAALLSGKFKVRTSETHGMAQRGGSVIANVRFGTNVEGPLIPYGEANIMLAFEASEALRNINYTGINSTHIINNNIIIPQNVNQMNIKYPDLNKIKNSLKIIRNNVYFISGNDLAFKTGNSRTVNSVMLGVLIGSEKIPINKEILEDALVRFIPKKAYEANILAFEIGIKEGKKLRRPINEPTILL